MTELNQMLSKHSQMLDTGRLHGGKNTYIRNWGLKKGAYFQELTVKSISKSHCHSTGDGLTFLPQIRPPFLICLEHPIHSAVS